MSQPTVNGPVGLGPIVEHPDIQQVQGFLAATAPPRLSRWPRTGVRSAASMRKDERQALLLLPMFSSRPGTIRNR